MSTIKPDGDVVTCPLHGLCWNVTTSELVSQLSEAEPVVGTSQMQ